MRICLKYLFLALGIVCVLLEAALPQTTWQNSSTSFGKKQLRSLLDAYPLHQIPRNGTDPLLVNIDVVVSNVLNVDITKYTLSAVLLLNQSWYNKELVWDEKEFPFSTLSVPWSSIWTPVFTIQEAFDTIWKIESPNVVLHSDGKTVFLLPLSIESSCNFNLFYYPLDTSSCTLSFFYLSNKVSEIEFKVSVENKILNRNREYLVMGVDIRSPRNTSVPYFVVKINLENTGIRNILSVIVPGIALIVADLCGFLVPLRDRLAYMVTLLLAYLVFHSSVVGSLPGSSSCTPLLSFYYTGLLVLLFLSTIETILVTKLVVDNVYLWQNCGLQGRKAKATTKLPKDQSYDAEDMKDPGGKESGMYEEPLRLNKASTALDRFFFCIYLGLLILFHCLIIAIFIFWKCEPEKLPGEYHLDGIKW